MIYKTFKALTYKDAVLNAKMEMGDDVYIIGRKEVKEGGILGLFTKNFTAITVAKNENGKKNASKISGQGTNPEEKKVLVESQEKENILLKELTEIKTRLKEITEVKEREPSSPLIKKIIVMLRENDFSEDFIERIRNKLENEVTLKDLKDLKILKERLRNYIMDSVETSGPIEVKKGKPSVVVLVGPTGVGKTTTIAKLAASYGVLQKHRVELLTIDSYRIAAIDQLGKYAELMQLPLTVINTREEFKSAISNSKSEVIFVDTAGRSQKNNLGLAELRVILDGVKSNLDIHLVLSATIKHRDALDVMTRFNQLMYNKVIITKLDETNTIGSILSIINKDKKLSYFTTGQSVPDDIELAEREKLLELLNFDETWAADFLLPPFTL